MYTEAGMHSLSKKTLIVSITLVVVLLILNTVAALDVPSHTEVSPTPSGTFNFPAQLTFFASLASSSNGIIANVTQGNFTNASARLSAYNRTIDDLKAAANNPQQNTVIAAMTASRDDYALLIRNAQRYNDLYVNESILLFTVPRSNQSISNALEMKALNGTLDGLVSTIKGRNADIYGIAVENGLNLSLYGNRTALYNAYTTQVDSRLSNITASVFQTPTLTLTGNKNSTVYGDNLVLSGSLQSNLTGVTNSSVEIHVDNKTVASAPTNVTGAYSYKYIIDTTAPGKHVVFAKYVPGDVPYNEAQSPTLNFSVTKAPVTNTLNMLSTSVTLGGKLQAQGRLTTPNGPVPNATMTLVAGSANIAKTKTDQNGTYLFSVPATGYYLSSLLNGTTVSTVFEPNGQPLDQAVSAAVHISADLTALYGIVALITIVVLTALYLYSRGFFKRAPKPIPPSAIPPKTKPEGKPPAEAREVRPVSTGPHATAERAPRPDWNALREQARGAFIRGDDESATSMLFDTAMTSLSTAAHVSLPAYMTYSEKSWALQAALPNARSALQELTAAYELVHYSGKSLTQPQRDAAISAFDALRSHVVTPKETQ
jgi:hypothetical protein